MTHRTLQACLSFALAVAVLLGAGCGGKRRAAADPKEAIQSAWGYYRLGEFQLCVQLFEDARAAAPEGSPDSLQALYGLATVWNLRLPAQDQNKALAAQLYQHILDVSPRGEMAPWATLALVRMKHLVPVGEDPDYAAVRAGYQQVMDQFPGHLAAREAFIYLTALKVASLETNQMRDAVAALQKFVSQTNDRSFFQPAYSLMAVSYHGLGMQKERLDAEIKSLDATEVDPENPFNEFAWQYWNIATIAEFELGDFDTARVYYHKLLDEYPRDRRIFGVKAALRRMDDLEAKIRGDLQKGGAS